VPRRTAAGDAGMERHMWRRQRTRIVVAVGAVVVVVAVVLAVTLTRHHPAAPGAAPASTAPAYAGVLAVKIDNVSAARPQTGLSAAQVIYVEPVEAGLTRLVAVYTGTRPARIGPVRSARETDLDLLAQWGRPVFAYSGAVPELVTRLHATPWLVNASEADVPSAYQRDHSRPAPHNLYLAPGRLPEGTGPAQPVLVFGAAPAGGVPTTDRDVRYPAARYDFRWSAAGRWLVTVDGTPFTSTETGRLGAATVVLQQVRTMPGSYVEDTSGNRAPIARTVGTGAVTVLRGGLAFDGTWSRPAATDPTRFRTATGAALPLAAGPVWIVLVPVRG
jgi:DUF3048 family protein